MRSLHVHSTAMKSELCQSTCINTYSEPTFIFFQIGWLEFTITDLPFYFLLIATTPFAMIKISKCRLCGECDHNYITDMSFTFAYSIVKWDFARAPHSCLKKYLGQTLCTDIYGIPNHPSKVWSKFFDLIPRWSYLSWSIKRNTFQWR